MSKENSFCRRGTISRRSLFKFGGAAAVVGLSPFVPLLRSDAEVTEAPKRIIFMVSHNGVAVDEFFPDSAGPGFALKKVLEPLEDFRDRMTILGNVNMDPAPGGAHTGQGMLLSNTIPNEDRLGMGISVDQFIASEIGTDTPFKSLLLGNTSHANGEVFLRGPADPIPAENDPYASFERIFGDFTGDEEAAALKERRGSTIDAVIDDLNSFQAGLPTEDKQIMELHLDSLREIEKQIDSDLVCTTPEIEGGVDSGDTHQMPAVSAINNQLIVSAMRCGLTRVGCMPTLRPVGNYRLTFLGIDDGYHDISHNAVPDSEEKMVTIGNWHAQQAADLCQMLADSPEGDGSMLDNTLIVYTNPLESGSAHRKTNLPIVMIGGGWYFQMGQYVQYDGEPHGKWLVSLCHAMGVDVDTFGREETSDGPLSGLIA